jgi:mono/diheme cytochrome c family protein
MRLLIFLALASCAFGADQATIQKGEKVFDYWCATCHGAGALPGTVALRVKYKGEKPAMLSERTDLTPAVMPFFRKTEVSDADLDAIGAYLARNNNTASH